MILSLRIMVVLLAFIFVQVNAVELPVKVNNPSVEQVDVGTVHGIEGPLILPTGEILFVEFLSGNILKTSFYGPATVIANVGPGVSGLALINENRVVVAKGSFIPHTAPPKKGEVGLPMVDPAIANGAVYIVELDNNQVTPLVAAYTGKNLQGPNDIIVDKYGDYWFTDFREGALYWVARDGSEIKMRAKLSGANGIAAFTDQSGFYVAKGLEPAIVAYELAARGVITERANGKWSHLALPMVKQIDGLKVNALGELLVAAWDDGLLKIAPNGELLRQFCWSGFNVINLALLPNHANKLLVVGNPVDDMRGKVFVLEVD